MLTSNTAQHGTVHHRRHSKHTCMISYIIIHFARTGSLKFLTKTMPELEPTFQIRRLFSPLFFFFIFFISQLSNNSLADVGTAAQYSPPYLPTACDGSNPTQFPSSNLFGSAGDGIWDNGASCGRQYLVRCISASRPGTCKPDETIQIKIVDYALTSASPPSLDGTTIVLSSTAFATIANSSATSINIEFQQV